MPGFFSKFAKKKEKKGEASEEGTGKYKDPNETGSPTQKTGSSSSVAAVSTKKKTSSKSSSEKKICAQPPPPPPPSSKAAGAGGAGSPIINTKGGAFDDSDSFRSGSSSLTSGVMAAKNVEELFPMPMADVPVPQLSGFFQVFFSVLSQIDSARGKVSSLKKLQAFMPTFAVPAASWNVERLSSIGFDESFPVVPLLDQIAQQPNDMRARLALAMYRFSTELIDEYEDEMMSCGTGFLSTLASMNPNLNISGGARAGGGGDGGGEAAKPQLNRYPNINLVKIYKNLIGQEDYIPSAEEVYEIMLRAQDILRAEPNVLTIVMPTVVVGDLHGQMRDLTENVLGLGGPILPEKVLAAASLKGEGASERAKKTKPTAAPSTGAASAATPPLPPAPEVTYLFLGDYVDRGANSVRCICLLLVAKILSPSTVFLIRGNHECSTTNRYYGFLNECHSRFPIVNKKVTTFRMCTLSPSEEDDDDGNTADPPMAPSSGGRDNPTAEDLLADIDGEAENETDSGGWALGDHPIWMAANEAFRMLPLCAVLCEDVEVPVEPAPTKEGMDASATSAAAASSTVEPHTPEKALETPLDVKNSRGNFGAGDASAKKAKVSEIDGTDPSDPLADTSVSASAKADSTAEGTKTKNSTKTASDAGKEKVKSASKAASPTSDDKVKKKAALGEEKSNKKSGEVKAAASPPTRKERVIRICAMHGGLSPTINDSIDGIIAINRFREIERGALADMAWSDPANEEMSAASPGLSGGDNPLSFNEEDEQGGGQLATKDGRPCPQLVSPIIMRAKAPTFALTDFKLPAVYQGAPVGFSASARGTGHIFGEDATVRFINTNKLYFVIRAHQCVQEGYMWAHHQRLLTVFSAPNYCGMRNKGAVLFLDAKGVPTLKQYTWADVEEGSLQQTASAPIPPRGFN